MAATTIAVVNEGTTHFVSAAFTDEENKAVIPDSISVKIDDEVSGQVIRAATSVSPAAEIEIEITAAENAMVDASRDYERRILTIDAVYSTTKKVTGEYKYDLKNLRFL